MYSSLSVRLPVYLPVCLSLWLQSDRMEDQRCSLPDLDDGLGLVPEGQDEFLSLVQRVQSRRMDEQRALLQTFTSSSSHHRRHHHHHQWWRTDRQLGSDEDILIWPKASCCSQQSTSRFCVDHHHHHHPCSELPVLNSETKTSTKEDCLPDGSRGTEQGPDRTRSKLNQVQTELFPVWTRSRQNQVWTESGPDWITSRQNQAFTQPGLNWIRSAWNQVQIQPVPCFCVNESTSVEIFTLEKIKTF